VLNTGYMPTHVLNEYKSLGFAKDITVELSGGKKVAFVEGDAVAKIGQLEGFSGVKSSYMFHGVNTQKHEPVEKKAVWVIRAAAGTELTLTAKSLRAGNIQTTLKLK